MTRNAFDAEEVQRVLASITSDLQTVKWTKDKAAMEDSLLYVGKGQSWSHTLVSFMLNGIRRNDGAAATTGGSPTVVRYTPELANKAYELATAEKHEEV